MSNNKSSKSSKTSSKSKSRKDKKKSKKANSLQYTPYIETLRENFFNSDEYDDMLMIDESEKVNFAWQNISYTVQKKKGLPCCGNTKDLQILDDLSGYCQAGTLTAILGPSGAGKTSLLNILSRRVKGDNVPGEIFLNNKTPSQVSFNKITSYVAQEDVVLGSLSAEEVLRFTAQLKLPDTMSEEEKDIFVEKLLKSLGLYHVRKNLIGYAGTTTGARSGIKRGLSGGERKRVSICIELVSNPKVLFLDEPTSGLDSYAAIAVVKLLRNLAFMGRTVICTIHQPSTDILRMFDNIMLLSAGKTMYFGPVQSALPYMDSIGYESPLYVNPAEFLLKVISVPEKVDENDLDEEDPSTATDSVDERNAQLNEMAKAYKKSKIFKGIKKNIEIMQEKDLDVSYQVNNSGFFKQYGLLFNRNLLTIWREPALFRVRIIIALFFSIITALLWFQLEDNLTDGLERISALFFISTSQLFGGLSGPTQIFTAERPVIYREKNSGMYSMGAFYLAKLTTEIPLNFFVPIISSSIAYWAIGFNDSFDNFLYFTLFFILIANVAHGLGMLLATSFDDPTTATKVQPLIIMPLFLFSGFFVNSDSIPIYFQPIEYISFFKYGFRGCAVSVFSGLNLTCDADEFTNFTHPVNVTVPVYNNFTDMFMNVTTTIMANVSICPIETGEDILNTLNIETGLMHVDIIFMISNIIIFNVFAFLALQCCKRD